MHLRLPSLILLATATLVASSRAQNPADVPPPQPPLVAAVPDAVAWTLTLKDSAAASSPSPSPAGANRATARINEVHTTKTGNIRRDVIAYSDGRNVTRWFVEMMVLWTTLEGDVTVSDLRSAPPVEADDANPSIPQGFPGIRWLQLPYYDKVVVVEKRPCYHYVHGESEAWIDAESRRPVAYKSGTTTYHYKFGDQPPEPLALPPDYQKALEKVRQLVSRRQQLELPPGLRR